MGNTKLQYAVRAVLAAAAASAVAPAYAQTAPAVANDTALQEVVVTGSRLAISPNDVSISPVTSVSSLDIQQSGLVRTEDLLNNLPQVVAEQSRRNFDQFQRHRDGQFARPRLAANLGSGQRYPLDARRRYSAPA